MRLVTGHFSGARRAVPRFRGYSGSPEGESDAGGFFWTSEEFHGEFADPGFVSRHVKTRNRKSRFYMVTCTFKQPPNATKLLLLERVHEKRWHLPKSMVQIRKFQSSPQGEKTVSLSQWAPGFLADPKLGPLAPPKWWKRCRRLQLQVKSAAWKTCKTWKTLVRTDVMADIIWYHMMGISLESWAPTDLWTIMINSFEVALGILRRYHMHPVLRQYRYIVGLLT